MAYDGFDRSVDSHIKNLRRKLEADPLSPQYVVTVYGVGYKFAGEAPERARPAVRLRGGRGGNGPTTPGRGGRSGGGTRAAIAGCSGASWADS